MKHVRNRKLVHPDGHIEWILARTVVAFGVEQQLGVVRIFSAADYQHHRLACAFMLHDARRRLREEIARVADQPAWIADNPLRPQPPYGTPGYECDSLALALERAHVFDRYPEARNTVERLKVGYPQWRCNCVKLTDDYRAEHASLADPTLALPAPSALRLTP